MNKSTPLLAALLLPALTGCIIHISTDGMSGVSGLRHWSHNGGEGPRIVGNGVRASESRALESWERIVLEGAIDADLAVGGEPRFVLSGDENLLHHVETKVSDGVLFVRMKDGNYSSRHPLVVEAALPVLRAVDILGSSDVEIVGLEGDFSATIKGSGDLRASGTARHLELAILGSGDLDLERVRAQDCSVTVKGSGDVEVAVHGRLEATISGSGDVRYSGRPETSIDIRGSGSVERAD